MAGLLLLVLGGVVLLHGLSFTSQKSVLKVGDFQASVEEHRTVPPWVGGLLVAGGILLIVGGSRRES